MALERKVLAAVIAVVFALVPQTGVRAEDGDPSRDIKSGNEAVRRGNYRLAIEKFEKAVVKAPGSAEARLGLSWAYYKERRFVKSVEQAAAVLEANPENSRAHALIGITLMRVGVLSDAAASFYRALQISSREALAHAGLAELDLYLGNLKDGLQKARTAVSRAPREPDFQYLLGQIAARQELFDEAALAYERYLDIAPEVDGDRRDRIRGLIDLYRRLSGRNLFYVSGPPSTSLPIDVASTRLPVIEVGINGQGPFRFVIDSGAGFVVVSDQVAKRLNLRPIAKGGTSRGVSGDGRFPIIYGILNKLTLGEINMENVPTYIRKIQSSSTAKIDGYIGLSVLSHFKVALDYQEKQLELHPPDMAFPEPTAEDLTVPYRMTNGGMLSILVDIGKEVPLNFIVDTGATSSVVSTKTYTRFNLEDKLHKGVTVRVIGAGGVTEEVPIVVLDAVHIKGTDRTQEFVRALVLDLEPVNETAGFEQSGILGTDFLRFFRVEIDFPQARLILRPNSGFRESGAVQYDAKAGRM